jgi:hypothetical protein
VLGDGAGFCPRCADVAHRDIACRCSVDVYVIEAVTRRLYELEIRSFLDDGSGHIGECDEDRIR